MSNEGDISIESKEEWQVFLPKQEKNLLQKGSTQRITAFTGSIRSLTLKNKAWGTLRESRLMVRGGEYSPPTKVDYVTGTQQH